jgi:uncharacterized cupin superfamily protein
LGRGDYKLIDGGKHWISRVHVDDVVRVIFAAEERAPQGAVYLVADDKPTTQLEHVSWICKRLGLPLPASVALYAPGMRRQEHRGRRIRNARVKAELGVELSYPTFVEGELALEAELRGETPGAAAAPTAPRPANVVTVADLPRGEEWSYPGREEKHGFMIELGGAVGLTRLGVNVTELPPGARASLPHAHSGEDELFYVLEGTPDVWIDGHLHRMAPGEAAGFPAGKGTAHTVLNNTGATVRLLVVGERRDDDRLVYPLDPARQANLRPEHAWSDAPPIELGPHDGLPRRRS